MRKAERHWRVRWILLVVGHGLLSAIVISSTGIVVLLVRQHWQRRSSGIPLTVLVQVWCRRRYNFLTCVIESSKSSRLMGWCMLLSVVALNWGSRRRTTIGIMMTTRAIFFVGAGFFVAQECGNVAIVTSPTTRWSIVSSTAAFELLLMLILVMVVSSIMANRATVLHVGIVGRSVVDIVVIRLVSGVDRWRVISPFTSVAMVVSPTTSTVWSQNVLSHLVRRRESERLCMMVKRLHVTFLEALLRRNKNMLGKRGR
jgi:hypothetical protein